MTIKALLNRIDRRATRPALEIHGADAFPSSGVLFWTRSSADARPWAEWAEARRPDLMDAEAVAEYDRRGNCYIVTICH